jgi:hypothetical protein
MGRVTSPNSSLCFQGLDQRPGVEPGLNDGVRVLRAMRRASRHESGIDPIDERPLSPLWFATMKKALILVGRRVGKAV